MMFDPTVFDNLKVIVEGYIYDLDLENEISVTNRSDNVDLATMSRKFTITFSEINKRDPSVMIEIEMRQNQLAGELLQTIKKPGCHINVILQEELQSQEYNQLLFKKLKRSWGEEHTIKLFVTKEVTSSLNVFHHSYQVCFQTKFGEDDIDELLHIVDHSISLLRMMSKA
ncbi:MAG: hypothetical protein ACQEWV_03720 [Bacillota bacterium]